MCLAACYLSSSSSGLTWPKSCQKQNLAELQKNHRIHAEKQLQVAAQCAKQVPYGHLGSLFRNRVRERVIEDLDFEVAQGKGGQLRHKLPPITLERTLAQAVVFDKVLAENDLVGGTRLIHARQAPLVAVYWYA